MHAKKIIILAFSSIAFSACQGQSQYEVQNTVDLAPHSPILQDDAESEHIHNDHNHDVAGDFVQELVSCRKATSAQLSIVNQGLKKLDQFLTRCYRETNSKKWCDQVARPNPSSRSTFFCTYSSSQPHYFVHPTESTWKHAIAAVKLVQDLQRNGVGVDMIYNWWRPEPYNANVGGAAGRHPLGTSVDVRFVNKTQQNKAHSLLCKYRKQGRLRALGYYSGTGLHLGVGDTAANTWGKACI